jgi:hypothetical protein
MTDYGHDLHFGTSITPVAQPPDLLTPIGPRRRVNPTTPSALWWMWSALGEVIISQGATAAARTMGARRCRSG